MIFAIVKIKSEDQKKESQIYETKKETEEEVKDSIKYIGIRAHYMKPSDVPEKINSMKIVSAGYTETPFENQHLFKNAENPKSRRLWYIEEKPDLKETTEQPLPTYMIFPKKSLMLLE